MDDTERHVAGFLTSKGYRADEIVYEPDGKVPPDFLLREQIAVEVRRLNQIYEIEGKTEGLEEASIPFFHRFNKMLESFGPSIGEHSWFVSYDFGRPEIPWPVLRPALKKILLEFVQNPIDRPCKYTFGKSLRIEIEPSSLKFETFFVLGAHTDDQEGGWVISEMMRNLTFCIASKSKKLEGYRDRYPEWWLILVDRISYGGWDANDVAEIRQHVAKPPEWDKIVVVDPANCARSFEL